MATGRTVALKPYSQVDLLPALCPADPKGYYHTAEAAASGLARRRQREEAASKAAARLSFCPNGWTACNVPGAEEGAYEVSSRFRPSVAR